MFCKFGGVSRVVVQCICAIIAVLAMASDGMQYGWASPAIPRLLKNQSSLILSKDESKWITQSYIGGNVLGVLLSVTIFNKSSRKLSIFIASLPILIGWIGNLLAPSLLVLCLARLIGGIGRNMAYVAVPMYIGEIADPKIRGILGSFIYLSMNIGVLAVYAITPFLPMYIPSIIGILIVFTQAVLLKFIPESPYYFLIHGNIPGAERSLKFLRKSNNIEDELQEMEAAVKRQTEGRNHNFKEMFVRLFTKKSNLKAVGIVLILRALQMLCGVSVMTMHVHTIFKQAGGRFSAEFSAIIYASIMLSSTLFSATTADRFGRRTLMIFSCGFTALILILQGLYFYLLLEYGFNMSSVSWLPIVNIVVFILTYRIGLGTVPIVMVSELFAADVKVVGVVFGDLIYSVASLTANVIFDYTEDTLGIYAPFWIFASFCAIGTVLSIFVIPETKGITLEGIQHLLMNKREKISDRRDPETEF